jgi:antitoxin StbD
MMERLDDLELAREAKARLESGEKPVRLSLDDLIAETESDIRNGH